MRFGVISDVHGNLHALRATVKDLRQQGVDCWLCLGDMIGYGPYPNECVEIIAELNAVGVAGNHELVALGLISGASSSRRGRQSHLWTAEVLSADVLAYLTQLPRLLEVSGGVVLTHGSLDDPEEHVSTVAAASQQLSQLAEMYPASRLLLLGNTHRQLLCSEEYGRHRIKSQSPIQLVRSTRHLANPGSVGQSRQWEWPPPARAMLLDITDMRLEFRRIQYDSRAARRELARRGLPYRSIQAPPRLRSVAIRYVRKLVHVIRARS